MTVKTLQSIGGGFSQITSAISGANPFILQLEDKIKFVSENLAQIVKINDKKVYRVTLVDETVFYYLRAESKTRYYHPVQYAKIEFELK